MSRRPAEAIQFSTRLLKCTLEVENSRAYWRHCCNATCISAQRAFDEYWFGAKSLTRVEILLTIFQARFGVVPEALAVLGQWPHMDPETRKVVCHWHLQFADSLYRRFTGEYLVQRRKGARDAITREPVIAWVQEQGSGRWNTSTCVELAGKLMSCAYGAGLLGSNRDPRPLKTPRVRDEALGYLMYLLRGIDFDGSALENPYVASIGLDGRYLEERLRSVPGLGLQRQGDLLDFAWQYSSLSKWGAAICGASAETMFAADVMESSV